MKHFYAIALALLMGFVLMACGRGSNDESAAGAGPDGEWVLESFVLDGDAVTLPDRPIDLRVRGNEVGGSAGCNSVGGTASFNGDGSAELTELFWTAMACAETALMEFESLYTQALSGVDAWTVAGDQLVLSWSTAELIYMPRVAPPALPINGTVWTLDTFFDGESASNQSGMELVTVKFSDTGASASAPCWSISGFATVEPGGEGNLSVDFTSADPNFSCDDSAFFSEMTSRLSRVTDYSIDENRLTLGDSSGPIIGFRSQG